ncbi:hypothetical protein TNCT_39931 [Trichonephila clavata]|uniref:Uncharacterized protein n=1 Tax=Trichonephila clavata TaxID=2740835 RepID=A0A8X6K5H1_TRICU|nr:hypothetical protein TNCT_39931 [Trichonephila clavata]
MQLQPKEWLQHRFRCLEMQVRVEGRASGILELRFGKAEKEYLFTNGGKCFKPPRGGDAFKDKAYPVHEVIKQSFFFSTADGCGIRRT